MRNYAASAGIPGANVVVLISYPIFSQEVRRMLVLRQSDGERRDVALGATKVQTRWLT
jgi:hypothetical protein